MVLGIVRIPICFPIYTGKTNILAYFLSREPIDNNYTNITEDYNLIHGDILPIVEQKENSNKNQFRNALNNNKNK